MSNKLRVTMQKVSNIVVFVKKSEENLWKSVEFVDENQSEEEDSPGVEDAEKWAKEKAFDELEVERGENVDVLVTRVYREGSIKKEQKVVTVEV